MNLADCYRILGLKPGSSFDEIKASYRRLARRYHPDVNPGDQRSNEMFIQLTSAYKFLLANVQDSDLGSSTLPKIVIRKRAKATPEATSTKGTHSPRAPSKAPSIQYNPELSPIEQQLKLSSYEQLQHLLKNQRFPRAITLVEGLAQRLPQDPEVMQWQAIAYQRWGRHLIQERQLEKARIYLKKALRADPHNRALWAEIEKDFRCLEQLF